MKGKKLLPMSLAIAAISLLAVGFSNIGFAAGAPDADVVADETAALSQCLCQDGGCGGENCFGNCNRTNCPAIQGQGNCGCEGNQDGSCDGENCSANCDRTNCPAIQGQGNCGCGGNQDSSACGCPLDSTGATQAPSQSGCRCRG